MSDFESKGGALGDANDVADSRPCVLFVPAGGLGSASWYVSVRMSPIPRVGERVRLVGSIRVGVFVPEADKPGPGRKLTRSAVLTGVVEAIEWTLHGEPDDVRVEIALRDVVESYD